MPQPTNKLTQFWQELKRRKVIRVIIVYAAAGFAIIEFVDIVTEPLNLPEWALTLVIVLVTIGFPLAVILAWAYDITPSGIEKTEPADTFKKLRNDKSFDYKTPLQEKSIIVLPFENISPDPEQEYFSDGLTEEIITDLSHIHDLLVISRSSAMTFKGTKSTIKEIAEKVNVRYVLEGSVRKAANNLRITAQLIDANNDSHLWAEKYNGNLDDVFDIQEKVSRLIVDSLRLKLTAEESRIMKEHPIENIQAYECYMRSRNEFWNYTAESFFQALKYLKRGLEIVGDNVLLYSEMGDVYFGLFDILNEEEYRKKAEDIVEKIFKIEPNSHHAHRILGQICLRTDTMKSKTHFNKTLMINPNDSEVLFWYGWALSFYWGKPFLAAPLIERLLRTNPFFPWNSLLVGCSYLSQGKMKLALESARNFYQKEPNSIISKSMYAELLAFNQQFDEAIHLFDKIIQQAPDHIFGFLFKLMKYAILGEKEKAIKVIEGENRVKWFWEDPQMSRIMAEGYSLLGEKDLALDWLENAVQRGFINYPLFSEIDSHFQNIHGEERFKKLMKRVKHEWENFEV